MFFSVILYLIISVLHREIRMTMFMPVTVFMSFIANIKKNFVNIFVKKMVKRKSLANFRLLQKFSRKQKFSWKKIHKFSRNLV
jgi:hypothetical protein